MDKAAWAAAAVSVVHSAIAVGRRESSWEGGGHLGDAEGAVVLSAAQSHLSVGASDQRHCGQAATEPGTLG